MHRNKTGVRLALLPLQILFEDDKLEMFCQGLIVDLITDLSRFRSLQIIAYDTVRRFNPDEQLDNPEIYDLHLDYVVKGMARHQNDNLLLNMQLIGVQNNRLVWAEKFSGKLDDIFRIQEDIVQKIVASLQHFLDQDLLSEIRGKPITGLNAYECWLRGFQELKKGTLEADERARAYFQEAMEIDPNYSRAYTGMSLSFFNEWSCQLWNRWDVSRTGAFDWAKKALELDEWDHVSNAILGKIYVFKEEFEKGEHYLRKSLRINSNDVETLVLIILGLIFLSYPKEARALYDRVKLLSSADNFKVISCGVIVLFECGEVDEAIELAEKHGFERGFVDYPAYVAAAYFLKGELEKMQEYWRLYLDGFVLQINGGKPADSQTALQWMIDVNPYREGTLLKSFWEYMSETGVERQPADKPKGSTAYENRFVHEGGSWDVFFEGKRAQLPDLKGFHGLARLLSQPNQPIHCTDLMGAQTMEKGVSVFDEKARSAYEERMLELKEEIEEAETVQDPDRLAALQEEYDRLIEHLTQAIGKGGRHRKVSGTIEKSRTAVTWRIRNAIKRIAEVHPTLGKHLQVSVKTGVFCEYTPERETLWVL